MPKNLQDLFLQHIQTNELFQPNDRLVIAVSGGADSVALLHLLAQLRNDSRDSLVVAHLHHGLRSESDQEYQFVQQLAKQYNIPFQGEKVSLLEHGMTGIEERARKSRYDFLSRVAKSFSAQIIVTAHHADDQVETTLYHFFQGAGLVGIGSIPAIRPINYQQSCLLVRPLLPFWKKDLIQLLQQQKQTWFEDTSNQDTQFTRNKIRHEIIPFLEKNGFPSIKSAVARTANHCREIQNGFEKEIEDAFHKNQSTSAVTCYYQAITKSPSFFCLPNNFLSAKIFLLPTIVRHVSKYLQEDVSWRHHHYEMLKKIIQEKKGSFYLHQDAQVFYHSKNIYFRLRPLPNFLHTPLTTSTFGEYPLGLETTVQVSRTRQEGSLVAGFAEDISFPLTFRTWKEGDRLASSKAPKISHLLSKAQVPKNLRQQILVVLDSQKNIIWLPGFYFSEKYTTPKPKFFVKIGTKTT